MDLKASYENFLYYYKNHLKVFIFIVVLLILSLSISSEKTPPSGIIPDVSVNFVGNFYGKKEGNFRNFVLSAFPDWANVAVSNLRFSDKVKDEMDIALQQKAVLSMAVDGRWKDVYIFDENSFVKYAQQGLLMNLDGLSKKFSLEKDKLLSAKVETTGEEHIYGFDITENKIISESVISSGRKIIAVGFSPKNIENSVKLVDFLINNKITIQNTVSEIKMDFAKIDNFINTQIEKDRIPGFSLGIVKNGQISYLKGYGKANNDGKSVSPSTPFIIGSVSKSFAALSVMQLVEAGKIDLDASVVKYIPYFTLKDKISSSKITVRHLLNHSSGIPTYSWREALSGPVEQDIAGYVKNLGKLKLTVSPGAGHQYDNTNYVILGDIVEKVSGLSYGEYVKENIFKPLDMKHSYVNYEEGKSNGLSSGYRYIFGFPVKYEPVYRYDGLPAAYIISSAEDLCHYTSALLNNGRYMDKSILSPEGIRTLFKAGIRANTSENYAMGWYVTPNKVIHHGGSIAGYQSSVYIFPKYNLSIVMLWNASNMPINSFFKGKLLNTSAEVVGLALNAKPREGLLNIGTAYNIMNLIIFVILALLLFSIYRLKGIKERLKKCNRLLFMITTIVLHFMLPVLHLLLPYLMDLLWSLAFWIAPDLALLIIFAATTLFLEGILKVKSLLKVWYNI
jgi:CubicO group peptidase (beta-lactamase class C family)